MIEVTYASQLLLEKPTTTPEEVRERNEQIAAISQKFIEYAKPIVETLVLERHLDDSQKTIKPISVGGIAGTLLTLTPS